MRKLTALIMLGLMLSSFAGGQVPNLPTAPPNKANEPMTADSVPVGVHELTAVDVEAFLDGIVPLQLEREDVAGATVAIVKDGKLLFSKGYGYADVKNKKPVSAEETLFRPGSVSKLFVWTAVMQLAEQGKLDLDRDINEYLDFKIPDAFGQPITLKNIMTHTAGFEEQVKDLFALDKPSPNLGEYVKTHVPQRIFAPGTIPAYSNYATTLAGYIVERVSGQPFDDYVEQNIFKPLGMIRSTFRQPLPPELALLMSNGYLLASDEAKPFESIGPFPAGSMSSTAADMSRFMLAHLQEGRLGEAQILRPETARLMHSRLFALDPAANAMAYGFYEESCNGRRIIGHGGDTVQFHSDLHLIPDAGVGFFVSYNSAGKGQISPRTILWDAFLDRYFPNQSPDNAPTLDTAKENAAAVSGTYMISRRGEGSFVKLLALLGEAKVSANDDGTISIDALMETNGKPKRWREVAPLTFRDAGGDDSVIFKPDPNGRMQIALPYPFMIFQRVGLWENGGIMMIITGISLFIMLLTLVLWFVAWLVRRHYGQKLELTAWEWRLRLAVRVVFALNLIFVVAFVIFGASASENFELLSDSGTNWLRLIQIIGVLGAVGTLVVFANAVHAWLSKRYRIWGKLQATVFALACLGFLWFVFAGHLLHFSSNY
ncbi:MAG: beta-lactamase family protein [Acidobacteriota bacterium]|nr:beta-lactamase family protein [Acidobacteriota bacterium]